MELTAEALGAMRDKLCVEMVSLVNEAAKSQKEIAKLKKRLTNVEREKDQLEKEKGELKEVAEMCRKKLEDHLESSAARPPVPEVTKTAEVANNEPF